MCTAVRVHVECRESGPGRTSPLMAKRIARGAALDLPRSRPMPTIAPTLNERVNMAAVDSSRGGRKGFVC